MKADRSGRMSCQPIQNRATGGVAMWIFILVGGVLALVVMYFLSASSR